MANRISELIKESLIKNGENIAYKTASDAITYEKLLHEAMQYADYLKTLTRKPIILHTQKEIKTYVLMVACMLARITYVPVSSNVPKERLKKIVELTKSELIITNKIENIEANRNVRILELDKLKTDDNVDSDNINSKNDNEENYIVYMIFTSGTTGSPKGVPISEENLLNFIKWINQLSPLKEYKNINVLNQANFSFDLSVADIYYSLTNGHTLVPYENFVANVNISNLFKENRINASFTTPTFMRLALLDKEFNSTNFPDLKCMYFCGERLNKNLVEEVFRRFENIRIINAYGPTECTSAVSAIEITRDMLSEKELPVGDTDKLASKIKIENDEIVIIGKSVFNGYLDYLNLEDLKAKHTDFEKRFYKTGDIGYIQNNKLYCMGRLDSQIKYKGYRIELEDIEKNILKIPQVKECVVVPKYEQDGSVKLIRAFVEISPEGNVDYIREKLKDLLPEYMLPKVIKVLEKLPVTNNGKIDRKALEKL